jgi:hypothetical protein
MSSDHVITHAHKMSSDVITVPPHYFARHVGIQNYQLQETEKNSYGLASNGIR